MDCGCGIPSKANIHILVVVGRNIEPRVMQFGPAMTETDYSDIYVCDKHDTEDTKKLLKFGRRGQWSILEETRTRLR